MVIAGAADQHRNRPLDCSGRRVNHDAFPLPRPVVAIEHLLPGPPAWVCQVPGLHATAMFSDIAAHELDLEDANMETIAHLTPRIARQRPRIDTISDDGSAECEIVRCDRLRNFIANAFNGETCSEHRLLDRVDPQVDGAHFFRRQACDR